MLIFIIHHYSCVIIIHLSSLFICHHYSSILILILIIIIIIIIIINIIIIIIIIIISRPCVSLNNFYMFRVGPHITTKWVLLWGEARKSEERDRRGSWKQQWRAWGSLPFLSWQWKWIMGPSNSSSLSFREIIHFHDYGRKGSFLKLVEIMPMLMENHYGHKIFWTESVFRPK